MFADYPIYLPWLALVALLLWLRWSFWSNKQVDPPMPEQHEITPSHGFGRPPQTAVRNAMRAESLDALDAIRRVMPTIGKAPDTRKSNPQMPIWKAVKHIAKVLGDSDKRGGYPVTLDAVRQAAQDGQIEIWGKRELPPPMEPGLSSDEWTPIDPKFWRTHQINSLATEKTSEACVHSCSNPVIYGEQNACWSLLVRLSDVERVWPGT